MWRKRCTELLVRTEPFCQCHAPDHLRPRSPGCQWHAARLAVHGGPRLEPTLRVHQADGLPRDAANLSLDVVNPSTLLAAPARKSLPRYASRQTTTHSSWPCCRRSCARLFNGEHLLLRSLSCNGKVVMLMVADQGGGPFSETTVQAFGKTAQCIEKALHSFTNRSA